jgi:cysteinylglycine-S-conjugate dipeptidase
VGGSISLTSAFAARFADAAIIATGVEDPDTRAHRANESLHLGEFARVCETEALEAPAVEFVDRGRSGSCSV